MSEKETLMAQHLRDAAAMTCCSQCCYWDELGEPIVKADADIDGAVTIHEGLCRRREPRVISNDSYQATWPSTQWDDWCGEFDFVPMPSFDEWKAKQK